MEMPSSLIGDKHEFCHAVIKLKHVRSCPSFDITYTTSLSEVAQIFHQGADICNCKHQQMIGV